MLSRLGGLSPSYNHGGNGSSKPKCFASETETLSFGEAVKKNIRGRCRLSHATAQGVKR